mgnify:CR=1 FL=1
MDNKFVSRGGLKLQQAIETFQIEAKDKIVLDVGSSTGGFVDCLLQNGAAKVFALDTAYGELAWTLRNDPRVVVMERTNILHLEELPIPTSSQPSPSGEGEKVDLITIDAGWTRLELVLKVVKKFLKREGSIVALLKPHYEAEKADLVKGVLREEKLPEVKELVEGKIRALGFGIEHDIESPILGGAGNKEFLLLLKIVQ